MCSRCLILVVSAKEHDMTRTGNHDLRDRNHSRRAEGHIALVFVGCRPTPSNYNLLDPGVLEAGHKMLEELKCAQTQTITAAKFRLRQHFLRKRGSILRYFFFGIQGGNCSGEQLVVDRGGRERSGERCGVVTGEQCWIVTEKRCGFVVFDG